MNGVISMLERLAFWRKKPRGRFHSDFGGLWVDKVNAEIELDKRVKAGIISEEIGASVACFVENGYAILPSAVSTSIVDRLSHLVAHAYEKGDDRLRYHTDGEKLNVLTAGTEPRLTRIVESHVVLSEVREAFSAPKLLAFLTTIFDENPVLTQSLIFHHGSEQGLHQDPVFVRFDQPLRMAACWIALQDIVTGTGELQYLVKSHRLPDYRFSTGRIDSHDTKPSELTRYLEWLVVESERRGLTLERFMAKKGDVIVWHSGLAHGGAPIKEAGMTRQSLVGHFCPVSNFPRYAGAKNRIRHCSLLYSSSLSSHLAPVD